MADAAAADAASASSARQQQPQQQSQQHPAPILHLWPAHAGLPSLTAASLQAEAYLRFCGADFCVERCPSAGASPTGALPALELGTELHGGGAPTDLAAARAVLAALRKARGGALDLDARLQPAQRAEAAAFALMVETRLEPATLWTTWLEARGYDEFRRAAYGASLPFPLSWVVPWSQRREVRRRLAGADGARAYADAADALRLLADRLRASKGRFFFGDRPSSLDALVFGHAAFYLLSPVAAPVLRAKVQSEAVLARFVESVLAREFSVEAPPPPPPSAAGAEDGSGSGGGWSSEARGQAQPKRPPTVEERRMWRGSQYWLAGAGAAVGAYVLLSGHYVDLAVLDDVGGDGDDDDDQADADAAELERHYDEEGDDDGGGDDDGEE